MNSFTVVFLTILSLIMTLQGSLTLLFMLYAWENPKRVEKNKSPKKYLKPSLSFSAIIPARHEENVIADTIRAVLKINYPDSLKEVLIVCHPDDRKTINKVKETIAKIDKKNIKLIIFDYLPISKPSALNIGLDETTKQVVAVFDAEDEPHRDIYQIVNTVMLRDKADVVQSGIQLMNFNSRWFSVLNVLEYFFWFKSALHFFTDLGFTPLGGNTVFFRKKLLEKIGGWDNYCLTEDADLGIRLSVLGAKIKVVYDENHVTKEETPSDVASFIRQRSRWDQGFLQILFKKEWLKLPKFSQKLIVAYLLLWPEIQAFLLIYILISIIMISTLKLPVVIAMFSVLPFYILFLQQIVLCVGFYEFTQDYRFKYPLFMPVKIFSFYYPFLIILSVCSLRALRRIIIGHGSWEKTFHLNAHRRMSFDLLNPVYSPLKRLKAWKSI